MEFVQKTTKLNDRGWMLLLSEISKGNVIPIIGDELFNVTENGKPMPFKAYIAKQLGQRLGIQDQLDVTQLSSKFFEPYWDNIDSDPYYETCQILKEMESSQFVFSNQLKELLSIDQFKLVLTTSFGQFVFKVMESVWGKGKVKNLSYEKHTTKDDIEDERQPTCYQIFGKANVCPNSFVLSDDDMLDFVSDWMSESYRPKRLSNLLRDKYLLVIGCNYPNWLFRFFLHSMKTSSHAASSSRIGLIADSKLDEQLVGFLSRMRTSIHDDAENFISELVTRYKDFKSEDLKKEIFISYASEDFETANEIAETFKRLGVGVWFDKASLEPGDEYVKAIKKNIEDCKAFIPILSKNVLNPGRRFYKREWTWASEEIEWRGSDSFIYPIAIDDVDLGNDIITNFFKNKHVLDFRKEDREENIKKTIRNLRSQSR